MSNWSVFSLISGCIQDFFNQIFLLPLAKKMQMFIRTREEHQRNMMQTTSKISWNRLQIWLEIVQGTFWRRSGASWGAQGVPDRNLGVKNWFVGPPLDPLIGLIFLVLVIAKLIWFCVWFLYVFWSDFAFIFGDHNASKRGAQLENVCFWFWAFRERESAIMEVLGLHNR